MVLWQSRHRIGRGPLIAVLFFAGTLFPALGFFDVYPMRYSFVADHFQYLASIGVIALGAAVLAAGAQRYFASYDGLVHAGAAFMLSVLGYLTWNQSHAYYDKPTLWRDTLMKNPTCWLAHDGLGSDCLARKELDEAERHFRAGLESDPDHAEGNCNLAVTLLEGARLNRSQGRTDEAARQEEEAIYHLRKALDANEKHYLSRESLGLALAQQGKREEAKEQFRCVMELEPQYGKAHLDMAMILLQERNLDAALREVETALQVEPNLPNGHYLRGIILLDQGRREEAMNELNAELQVNPRHPKAGAQLKQLQSSVGN
jgi:tetratricopeptide (TPR) repeat protein